MFFRRKRSEFRGYLDGVHQGCICGWVHDRQNPKVRQSVDIYYAGQIIGTVRADVYREDLKSAGFLDGCYGFKYLLPENITNIESLSACVQKKNYWLLNNIPRQLLGQTYNNLINNPRRGLPILQPALSTYALKKEDVDLAEEIITIWRELKKDHFSSVISEPGSMWTHIIGERHKNLISLLNCGRSEQLADYLTRIHQYPESTGIYQGAQAYEDFIKASEVGRRVSVTIFQDMLASLTQYLAIDALECGEQEEEGSAITTNSEAIVQKIEKKIGYKITQKNLYDGVFGLKIENAILHGRDIQALYLALRQSEILSNKSKSIIEIGAGFGLSAYYAWLEGCDKYIIIDLPSVCIIQYFTLKRLLPQLNIQILEDGAVLPAESGIFIIPATYVDNIASLSADLTVNVDSLPEMGEKICMQYIKKIPSFSPLLLSINQEANQEIIDPANRQMIVSSMLGDAGYRRYYRFRSWIRQGYAEELWQCPPSSSLGFDADKEQNYTGKLHNLVSGAL